MWKSTVELFFLLLLQSSSALRILIVGTNIGYSHLGFTGQLADVLVKAGHEVDFLIPMLTNAVNSNGTKLARVKRLKLSATDQIEAMIFGLAAWSDAFEANMDAKDWAGVDNIFFIVLRDDNALIDELKAANYEVAMAENFDSCGFALFHHLQVPSTHILSAIPLDETIATINGISIDFTNRAVMFNAKQFTPIETSYERLRNTWEFLDWRFRRFPKSVEIMTSSIRRVFGSQFPSIVELLRAVDYVWLNTNEQLEQPRALSSKIKSIGGIAVKKSGGLTEEMERLLNNSTEGAVLVSFGSIVDTTQMNTKLRDQFLEAFSRFPGFQFVWKVTRIDESLQSALKKHPNVRAVEWMDQSGILEHANTRAFITHGGLNSINEAATFGVPLITIPFFGDQHINSAAVVSRGLAVALDRRRISADSVASALTRVLRSSKFELTAKDVKRKIASAPISPSELFVRHVEFAAQHGGLRELQLPAASQSLWRQLSLDVWLTLLSGLVLLSLISLWSLRVALNFVTNQLRRVSVDKKKCD
ncbi:UDP-glucuronosyltransferase [Aphelenchoides besseyi]|nr:UDP-glucuronosyltransferase [Aphelenchoides besseyi]